MEGHPFLTIMFGQRGLVFNLVLPPAIYSLIPVAVIWLLLGGRRFRENRLANVALTRHVDAVDAAKLPAHGLTW